MARVDQSTVPGVNRLNLSLPYGRRPPHPHVRSTIPTPPTPITWSGISFARWGGLDPGRYSDILKKPFPWHLSLFNATITRYYFHAAVKKHNLTARKLAQKAKLPEQVVDDILNYGYGWLPDFRKLCDMLQIIPILLPPEIQWMTDPPKGHGPRRSAAFSLKKKS